MAAAGETLGPFPVCSPEEAGLSSKALKKLRDAIDCHAREFRDTGSVCAVLRNGKVPFVHCAGQTKPAALNSLHRLYSMTKPLVAVTFLSLVDQGLLGFDDPLERYLPCFAGASVLDPLPECASKDVESLYGAFASLHTSPKVVSASQDDLPLLKALGNPRGVRVEWLGGTEFKLVPGGKKVPAPRSPAGRPITLRMLLFHTSGLGYGPGISEFMPMTDVHRQYGELCDATENGEVKSLEEWVSRLARIPLLHQPGEQFEYGYSIDVLGRVIEVVTGDDLRNVVRSRVCKPLEMSDTDFWVPETAARRLLPLHYGGKERRLVDPGNAGSGWVLGQTSPVVSGGGGVERIRGGAVGTLDDYLRFCGMLLNLGASPSGRRILSVESAQAALADGLVQATGGRCRECGKPGIGFCPVGEINHRHAPSGLVHWSGVAGTYFSIHLLARYAVVFMSQGFSSGDLCSTIDNTIMAALAPELPFNGSERVPATVSRERFPSASSSDGEPGERGRRAVAAAVPAPLVGRGFFEAHEFYSKILKKDPQEFSVQWRAAAAAGEQPPKGEAPRVGRWQALTENEGHQNGTFILHCLPPGRRVEVRVLHKDAPSPWAKACTEAVPRLGFGPAQTCDLLGNEVGGIRGVCQGWVLEAATGFHLANARTPRCLRCGSMLDLHERRRAGDRDPS